MNRRPGSAHDQFRVDLQLIADMVAPGSRVLDVGCGDGLLLDHLVHQKQVDGRGIELSQSGVNASVSRGLAVIQGDAETDLGHYPSDAFDYVILSQTLPAIFDVKGALGEMLRIGRHAVVSFPNFGYWRVRGSLLFRGRSPESQLFPYAWYESPNIRFFTLTDFTELIDEMGFEPESIITVDDRGRTRIRSRIGRWTNLLAEQAVYLLARR